MTIYRGVPLSDLPQGHYAVGLIDPPWRYLAWSNKGLGKSADRHYETMTIDQLKALPVRSVFAKNAVIFVWVIDSHLELALDVINAWGFRYKTVGLYWVKTTKDGEGYPMGTGFWTRANPEHTYECWAGDDQEVERCLLATTPKVPTRQDKGVPRLMISPRREHSRKPDETHERVERLVNGPYLEMFSRTDREGWDVWGHEAGNYAIQKRLKALKTLQLDPEAEALV